MDAANDFEDRLEQLRDLGFWVYGTRRNLILLTAGGRSPWADLVIVVRRISDVLAGEDVIRRAIAETELKAEP